MKYNLSGCASFLPESLQEPNAWVGHLPFASWLVNEVTPKVLVELGTHSGNSYFSFCQSVKELDLSTKCYAVDTWQGDEHAGSYSDEIFAQVDSHNRDRYAKFSQLMRMTFDEATDYFADGSIDLLHIDGLHTYDAVRHDFENWLPKLAPGAVVLLHDTNVRERDFGVWKLWEELAERYPDNLEFLHSNGLGVLQVATADGKNQLSCLRGTTDEKQQLKDYFSALGQRQMERFELLKTKKQIDCLTEIVNERDARMKELYTSVNERDGNITELYRELDHINQALVERDLSLNQLHLEIAERDRIVTDLNRIVTEIYHSKSWRITRPLRAVRRVGNGLLIRLPLRFFRNIFLAFQAGVRRYGFKGFIRRLPYYLSNLRSNIGLLNAGTPAVDGELFNGISHVGGDSPLHPDLCGVDELIPASVSIVIPTLNAGPEFAWLLRKLHAQKGFDRLEIIIVDSGSSDQTLVLARGAGCHVIEIPQASFSHSYARNLGAEAAETDYLLFMVQDAYPIGEFWLHGMLRFLLDHSDKQVAAVSCAEYSRSDSDIMYDSMIDTHYRFLGCDRNDRIGEYCGDDHMSLRARGQLSDVSCLIEKVTFDRYKYRGDYAEDLDLGIRLIKDGYRVAMLSSIKVIHSHNRSAHYYLKRSFVDVVFLTGMFDDFIIPQTNSIDGLLLGIVSTAVHLTDWLDNRAERADSEPLPVGLGSLIKQWRKDFAKLRFDKPTKLGDENLDNYINSLFLRSHYSSAVPPSRKVLDQAYQFLESFLARLDHFVVFFDKVYGEQDLSIQRELEAVLCKTFAAATGSALAYLYIDYADTEGSDRATATAIYEELKAGI